MANYIIFLEGINREFFIEADSKEEALAKAKEKYRLSIIADVIEDGKPILKQKCLRCGYAWYPKSETLPKTCPKCKSPYWNKPRTKGGWLLSYRSHNVPRIRNARHEHTGTRSAEREEDA